VRAVSVLIGVFGKMSGGGARPRPPREGARGTSSTAGGHAGRTIADLQPPTIDLSDLWDLGGTLRLLRSTGVLP